MNLIRTFLAWRHAKVRLLEFRNGYIRFTPMLGIGMPWFRDSTKRPRRLRVAKHHGFQIVTWYGARWVVTKQLLGKSTVNKEAFDIKRRK
jgi:hypothetical protein